jgi:predicted TIM-barrel fold metal-dependent hydrolase
VIDQDARAVRHDGVVTDIAPAGGRYLADYLASVPLVDHHVHGAFAADMSRADFERSLNEASPDPIPDWMTQFDSQLGFAIRRWCAPLLGLPAHAPADDYWARRCELGGKRVTELFLGAAGVSDWLVDTGYGADALLGPAGMAVASGGRAHTIVRLESLAEQLATSGVPGRDYPEEFRARLAAAAWDAVGVKTIIAYRSGFGIDLSRPDEAAVRDAASRWIEAGGGGGGGPARLDDPVLLRFGLHAAVDLGLPIQVHTGLGDRDLDLHKVNPLLLLDFLRIPDVAAVPVMLLHCYPYHREAGYLAQAFHNVYFDVGLSVNFLGARSPALIAESFELAPFAKQLYSSDAWGLPELHYLGAVLWRRAMAATLGGWVDAGDWSAADAARIAAMVGASTARRVYRLG